VWPTYVQVQNKFVWVWLPLSLTVPISTNDLHCWKPTRRWHQVTKHSHARSTPTPQTDPTQRPSLHALETRQLDACKTDVPSSANGPSSAAMQQKCHNTSASAQSSSWPPMPGPRLQRAATVWPDWTKPIQTSIRNSVRSIRARKDWVVWSRSWPAKGDCKIRYSGS